MCKYQSGSEDLRGTRSRAGGGTEPEEHRQGARRSEFMREALVPRRCGLDAICSVHDVSAGGARLEMDRLKSEPGLSADEIEDQIDVQFPREGTVVPCEVAWRDGRHFGVKFIGAPRPARAPAG